MKHRLSKDPLRDRNSGPLSKLEVIQALRMFLYNGIFWAAYGQIAGVFTPIFTGFALFLGVKESDIGTIVSFVSLAGLAQLLSLFVSRGVQRKRRFILPIGFAEILITLSVIAIPLFLAENLWFRSLILLVTIGAIMGHMVAPVFQSWFATVVPEEIRARYLSKRTIIVYLSSMVVAYLAGRFLDGVGGYRGFAYLFAFGILMGISGYLILLVTPLPAMGQLTSGKFSETLLTPFRNRDFVTFLVFYTALVFALGIANPFYSVFMIRRLQISYSTIAILNNIAMFCFIIGLKIWGGLLDRYGNKPVLELLMIPAILIPIMWLFNSKDNFVLLPAAMFTSGLVHSGITIAVSNFLFALVPRGEEKTSYFAMWASSVSIAAFIAPNIGAMLVGYLEPTHFKLAGFPVGNLQMVFIISSLSLIGPAFLLKMVREEKAVRPGYLLGHLRRGNPFLFAYNFFLFSRAKGEKTRAQAAYGMGKSKSPMAVDKLTRALDDLSPQVRSQAARALGETRWVEAVAPLVAELRDLESDIRPEAAQALGKIRSREGIASLLKALDDPDNRVKTSAAMALAEIGGEEVKEQLFQRFSSTFDRSTFPTFLDALSRMGDRRIIIPGINGLDKYTSLAIRAQILNSLCRVLGAGDRFYKLMSTDDLGRTQQVIKILKECRRRLLLSTAFHNGFKGSALQALGRIIVAFQGERYDELLDGMGKLSVLVQHKLQEEVASGEIGADRAVLISDYLKAILRFLTLGGGRDMRDQGTAFLSICLRGLVEVLTKREKG